MLVEIDAGKLRHDACIDVVAAEVRVAQLKLAVLDHRRLGADLHEHVHLCLPRAKGRHRILDDVEGHFVAGLGMQRIAHGIDRHRERSGGRC